MPEGAGYCFSSLKLADTIKAKLPDRDPNS
jgi:hypothetical protein